MIDINSYVEFIREVCTAHGWKKDWSQGGCYTHLEVSEFIEAVRGKKGDPVDELGDVLFTVLAVADYYGIGVEDALNKNVAKHKRALKEIGQ